MESFIVGTAGHIDHGKTALIHALNGFDGDTTPEEKKRGITADLSFSNLLLRDKNIAFIDVPGHEKLIKNMIAGAFGFNSMMLVISAVEGIKPQTIEHLQIANLLEIPSLLIIITKCDLVDDVQLETRKTEALELAKNIAPNIALHDILGVSIHDKESLEALKESLYHLKKNNQKELGFFRYYIDRAFSIKGAGCVVSGTVLSGKVEQNQKIWSCELQRLLNVRGIEVHGVFNSEALPSERAALNLSGISHTELERGFLLSQKGYLRGFDTIDVEIFALEEIPHQLQVQLFIGSRRVEARILRLDEESKNNKILATLKCDDELFSIFGERFILRECGRTIGGGRVLNPVAEAMKKRQKTDLLSALSKLDFTHAFTILLQAHKRGFGIISATQRFALTQSEALEIAKNLKNVFVDEAELVIYPLSSREFACEQIRALLARNRRALLSSSSLALKIPWASKALLDSALEILKKDGELCFENGLYLSPNSGISNIDEYLEQTIYAILKEQGNAPLAPYNIYDSIDIDRKSGDNALKALTKAQKVVRLEHNLFITSESLSKILELMRNIIRNEGYIEIGNFKNYLPLSRKYLISYLEYLDKFGDIKKEGNQRTFR
ncbi:MAG: selenocysteine-specific translation elongation factor [Wolinella sp.]